jgi:hypothetical protein
MPPIRWQPALYWMLLIGIFLAAGPEIAAAIELTALVDILGAALFLTAFVSGFKLLLIDAARFVQRILLPVVPLAAIRHGCGPAERGNAIAYTVFHAGWCVTFLAICVAWAFHAF